MTRGTLAATVAALALVPAPSPAQESDAGARAFQKCISCHSVDRAETGLSGPTLAGLIGRRAAALPGFEYSPAMRRAAEAGRPGGAGGEPPLPAPLGFPR